MARTPLKKEYLCFEEKVVSDLSTSSIESLYDNGFVATRIDTGVFHQTRSVRIDLLKFELNSENRRILRKGEDVSLSVSSLPLASYDWNIGKMAKDFYDTKAGVGTFSANKVKEILSLPSHFSSLFSYTKDTQIQGYCITVTTPSLLHYCYPFYLLSAPKDMGLIMMLKAIVWAKENSLKYVYLGSLQRPNDVYKLQFSGIQWFDGKEWSEDVEGVKRILSA